jgi:hypothetical protein
LLYGFQQRLNIIDVVHDDYEYVNVRSTYGLPPTVLYFFHSNGRPKKSLMKRTFAGVSFLVMTFAFSLRAQGDFQNLNFESAQVIPPYPASSATSNAVPGWTAFTQFIFGGMTFTQQLTSIQIGLQPSWVLGNFPPVALLLPPDVTSGGGAPYTGPTNWIDGNFCVLLGGSPLGGPLHGSGFISQTDLVPADAQTLLFKVHNDFELSDSVQASFDGQNLSLVALLTVPENSQTWGYTLYGADISSLAGQTADLVFSSSGGGTGALLDDIEFSSLPIPEPSGVSLIFLGIGVFIWFGRRARGRSRT